MSKMVSCIYLFFLINRRGLGGRGLLFIEIKVHTCNVSINTYVYGRIRKKRITVYILSILYRGEEYIVYILARFTSIDRRGIGGRGLLFIISLVYSCNIYNNTEESHCLYKA